MTIKNGYRPGPAPDQDLAIVFGIRVAEGENLEELKEELKATIDEKLGNRGTLMTATKRFFRMKSLFER